MSDELRLRLNLFGVLILGLFIALVTRLWFLQVVESEQLVVQARQNFERTTPIGAPRGRILDINGRVLVGNRVTNLVTVDKFVLNEEAPSESDRERIALALAREISKTGRLIKAQEIENAFNDAKWGPFDEIPIATDVTEEFAILLGERLEDFPGVDIEPTTVREYPFGQIAAHVLGTVGSVTQEELALLGNHPKPYSPNDDIGKSGIEKSFEDVLRGQPGSRVFEVDALNKVVNENEEESFAPQPGSDVVLTIDVDVQRMVEEELRKGIEFARTQVVNVDTTGLQEGEAPPPPEFQRATGGAMVLLDPSSSQVLAMASYPTYNPEAFIGGISSEEFDLLQDPAEYFPLVNRAVAGLYSPGSTFKPFTSYAAMDTGLLGPRGFLDVGEYIEDKGFWRIPDCESDDCYFQNARKEPFGDVNLPRAITVSSDVFYYQLAYQFDVRSGFPARGIQDAAAEFGFGRVTGIQLPEDSAGLVPDKSIKRARHEANPEAFPEGEWRAGDTLNVSIGQGDVNATPLQVANAYAALANGGTLHAPQIVTRIEDPVTSESVREFGPRVINEIFFPDWIERPLMQGLEGVVNDEDGTAYFVFHPNPAKSGEPEAFPLNEFPVSGKTGTVENTDANKQDSSAFAAMAPMPSPEFVSFVYVEEAGFGSAAAAPITRAVYDRLRTGEIDEAPTAAEIEEYYRSAVFTGEADPDSGLPTGDVVEDITLALDTNLPNADDPAEDADPEPSAETEDPPLVLLDPNAEDPLDAVTADPTDPNAADDDPASAFENSTPEAGNEITNPEPEPTSVDPPPEPEVDQ